MSPLWFQERYRKALADSENVRRRTQKFVEDAKLFGKQKSCVYLTGLPDWAEKMLISSFPVPLSCPPSFVLKPAVMFGLDSWYLGLITIFFSVSSCVLSYQVYPQNHRILTFFFIIFFLNSPSAAEFSCADLVENAGCAVCWGLALAGCILSSAVSSGYDLLY